MFLKPLLRGVFFLLFITGCLSFPLAWKEFTRGFKPAKLQVLLPNSSIWNVDLAMSSEEVEQILSQPFYFLGKGAQCYAFVSQDDQYVLKLFRFDRRKRREGERRLFPQRKSSYLSTVKKADAFFTSCKIGYELAREETSLVYLHLNLTEGKLPVASLLAPSGYWLRLPLDQYRFALQKKAVWLEKALFSACSLDKLEARLDALANLLERRCAKGIGNRDPNLWRNFGFVGDSAVEIDFGNYLLRPDLLEENARKNEIWRYASSLRIWLEEHAPETVAYFDKRFGQVGSSPNLTACGINETDAQDR